jgi:hypothetical protein
MSVLLRYPCWALHRGQGAPGLTAQPIAGGAQGPTPLPGSPWASLSGSIRPGGPTRLGHPGFFSFRGLTYEVGGDKPEYNGFTLSEVA